MTIYEFELFTHPYLYRIATENFLISSFNPLHSMKLFIRLPYYYSKIPLDSQKSHSHQAHIPPTAHCGCRER